MAVDPSVLAAIRAAADADPANAALALHLADMLIQDGQAGEALERCRGVLGRDPANAQALDLAALAAAMSGDDDAAGVYRRAGAGPPSPGDHPPDEPRIRLRPDGGRPPRPEDAGADDEDDLDPGDDGDAWDDGVERPTVTLADVGGLEQVKRRLHVAFLGPMRNEELRAAYGKSLRGGLLLYGPPGCGKTFIARALAGELQAGFQQIGISDVLDMYLGESERRLHEVFETARRHAPCVLFLDEIDALGQKRSHLRHSAGRNIVNQLLAELDGAAADNEGVFVLAATNHPWDVDTALRRPGRLDRSLLVLPPDEPARRAILATHLRDRPVSPKALDAIKELAKRTETFSGADLAHLTEAAAEKALERSIDSGRVEAIGRDDLRAALGEVRPSTRAWFDVAYNYAMFANEGGEYDDLLAYVRDHRLR